MRRRLGSTLFRVKKRKVIIIKIHFMIIETINDDILLVSSQVVVTTVGDPCVNYYSELEL